MSVSCSKMVVNVERSPFCYLKPFMILLQVFGLMPSTSKPKAYKAYVLVLILASLYGCVFSTVMKETSLFMNYPKIMKFIDEIYNLLLSIACIAGQIFMVFLYPQKIQNILYAVSIAETTCNKMISTKYLFWIAFFICNFVTAVVLSVDTAIWVREVGFNLYRYYTLRNIQYYQTNILLLFEMWLCLEQRNRFKHLNFQLEDTLDSFIIVNQMNILNGVDSFQIAVKVKNIKKSHNRLCNIVESFSEVFGTLIVLEVIFFISIVISYTLIIIFYLLILKEEKMLGHVNLDAQMITGAVIFVFSNGFKLFALAAVGELLYQEAHKATRICYDSINKIETTSQLGSNVVKELLAFVQQLRDRNPKIAASSCFDVRFGMMGFVIGSVTSYIIIAVQFMVQ